MRGIVDIISTAGTVPIVRQHTGLLIHVVKTEVAAGLISRFQYIGGQSPNVLELNRRSACANAVKNVAINGIYQWLAERALFFTAVDRLEFDAVGIDLYRHYLNDVRLYLCKSAGVI